MKFVKSKRAPEPIGPYSQAVVVKNLVFVSGMIAVDPATGKMVTGGVKEQTERALVSLKAVLKAAGTTEKSVAKTTVF
ncbi:MAG: Rid family hydrolase, partial [Thaumarchaeota archaeon]|nr:Rid family hydrolase [Nitrososphaerota archaeon]